MDSVKLTTILPEDAWVLIFDHVDDPTDFENLNNSSSYFRHLLHSKLVLFLFPKVFQILVEKDVEDTSKHDDDEEEEYDEYDEDNTGTIPIEYLQLRSVCSIWKHTIENYYHQQLFHHMKQGTHYQWTPYMYDVEDVHEFGQHFVDIAGNDKDVITHAPFYSRTISIKLFDYGGRGDDEGQEFLRELTNLFQKYGHHIWNFGLMFEDAQPYRVQYQWMVTFLRLMPNLKTIRIDRDYCDDWVYNVDGLLSEINSNPMPTFEGLHFLSLRSLADEIVHEFLRRNPHVHCLSFGLSQYNRFLTLVPLPHLVDFSTKVLKPVDLRRLQHPQVDWKLRKLDIVIWDNSVDLWYLFNIIKNKWPKTLSSLKIQFPSSISMNDRQHIREQCASLRLSLGRLKYLSLDISHFTSLDFILPMKQNLEHLHLYFTCSFDENEEDKLLAEEWEARGTIKLMSYLDRPYDSNIWKLFPKLKEISCKFHKFMKGTKSILYTRQEWSTKTCT